MSIATEGMIDLARVRELAGSWHGGQASPLYALASSGAIIHGIIREIEDCIATAERWEITDPYAPEPAPLRHLLVYVTAHGFRGPVEGWSDIHF